MPKQKSAAKTPKKSVNPFANLSPEERAKRLKDLDLGFRVLRQIEPREIETGEDILWYCIIDSALTFDQKTSTEVVEGAEIFYYGNNGDELAGCFTPMLRIDVIYAIAEKHIKRVYFDECCFASDIAENEVKAFLEMKTPGCEVFIVNFRKLFNRSDTENFDQYRRGYFKALLDAHEWLLNHNEELKFSLLNSPKGYLNCLDAMREQVTEMMRYGSRAEIKVKLLYPEKVKEKEHKHNKTVFERKHEKFKDVYKFDAMCIALKRDGDDWQKNFPDSQKSDSKSMEGDGTE